MNLHLLRNLTIGSDSELTIGVLVLALMGCSVVAGLLAYRARSAGGAPFHLWTIGWLLFMVSLAASIRLEPSNAQEWLVLCRTACVGLAGLFVATGTWQLTQPAPPRREIGMSVALIVLGTYVAYQLMIAPVLNVAAHVFFGFAVLFAGVRYAAGRHGNKGARLLLVSQACFGFLIGAIPVLERWYAAGVVAWFVLAASTLAIAMSLIIDQELVASEAKFRAVFDSAPDGIFVVDLWSLQVLEANQAAHRLAKLEAGELAGRKFTDLCPDLRQKGANLLDHRSMFNAVFRPDSEFHIARTDGELVLCEGETNLIRWHQESVLQVKVRRLADREKLHQVMRRAEKMSALGRLVAGVAHELNNPLAVVMGYAQLMVKQQNLDETTRQEVRRILHEAERASKIVVDLLSFARPTEPQMVVVDLNQIVQNLLEVREPDLAKHNIQLLARLSPTLPRTKADPFQVEQVLSNLVTNAIHALSEHPGERTLEVDTEVDGFFIRVTVADSGPGIPPNLLEKIFEPFFTTKAPGKGTGLGLPISRSILEEHHGRLRAESEPGQGARFIIELPVISCADAVEVPQAVAALVNEEDEQPAASSGPKQVLIVDDEPGILEVLQAVLAGNGCVVATATTGTEAWNRIRAGGIDLVISDVNIPGLTGEQLFQQVRTALPALGRRFIFLTGDTLTPAARGFLEKSGARWFAKPFNIRDVERAVDNLLHPEPVAAILGTAHHLK